MADERWIVVPNWDRFQHYSDREPVWLKLYMELRDKAEWEALNYTERGLLVSVWMEYCAARGQLSCSRLGKKTGWTTRSEHLTSLSHAGFIEIVASKPLALARSREVEKKREEVRAGARAREARTPDANEFPQLTGIPTNNDDELAYARVARMINLGVLQDQVDLEAEIRGFKITGRDADRLRQLMP